MILRRIYDRLHGAHGHQNWWPGETPFEVMVGAILTQNTAWTNVEKAIGNLRANDALGPEAILSAGPERLAEWLRPSGYFNVKADRLRAYCRWYLDQGGFDRLGRQDTETLRGALLAVKGVGPETADDILLYAFERPVFVIDAYTRRIFSRLGVIAGDEPYERLRRLFEEQLGTGVGATALFNDYHAQIVIHGKDVCRKRPLCDGCCLRGACGGRAE